MLSLFAYLGKKLLVKNGNYVMAAIKKDSTVKCCLFIYEIVIEKL